MPLKPTTPLDAPPQGPVRLADIAETVGVSRSVVGYVLNGGKGNSRVSQKTAERIREAARQMNYRPDPAAMRLRGWRTHTYGTVACTAGGPLRSYLVQYLDIEAAKVGCQTLIGNSCGSDDVPSRFDYHVEEFTRRGVDGVFCVVRNLFDVDRQSLVDRHPHTIFYDDPNVPNAAYVYVDRADAVRQAVRHLIGRRRERIGLALAGISRPTWRARRRGYIEELAAHNRTVDERLIFDGESFGDVLAWHDPSELTWTFPTAIIDEVVDKLVRDAGADAIIAHNDYWAAMLLNRLRARGIRVPHDVAVVGYFNHYLADWIDPPLTSVDLQHSTAARMMVQMMERLVEGQGLAGNERVLTIKPKLVIRGST